MDITTRQSLVVLWSESFAVVRRAAFKLIAVVVLFAVLMGGLGILASRAIEPFLVLGNVIVALASAILFFLAYFFVGFYVMTVFWRILGLTADNTLFSLPEVLSSSFKPALYCCIGQLLWTIAVIPFAFALQFVRNPLFHILAQVIFFLAIVVRIVYAFPAIVLRGQGPVSGFMYSWRLTGKNYIDTILMCVMCAFFPILMALFVGACGYGLYVGIPLYFADSFNIVHLTWPWFAVLGLIGLGMVFIWIAMLAFPIVVFVNRDNEGDFIAEDSILEQNPELGPLTEEVHLQKPAEEPKPEPVIEAPTPERDIGPAHVQISETKITPEEEEPVEDFMQATFRAEANAAQLQKHLEEVYQPKHTDESVIEYAEEDRMPTIVFDDQMAQQLEENRKFWQNEPKEIDLTLPDEKKDDGSSIKMSK